jgi:hypothetical protein
MPALDAALETQIERLEGLTGQGGDEHQRRWLAWALAVTRRVAAVWWAAVRGAGAR